MENASVSLVSGLIPLLVPFVVQAARLAAPKIPRAVLPVLALVAGVGIDYLLSLVGAGTFSPMAGAILGAVGVWVREFVNTLQQHGVNGS